MTFQAHIRANTPLISPASRFAPGEAAIPRFREERPAPRPSPRRTSLRIPAGRAPGDAPATTAAWPPAHPWPHPTPAARGGIDSSIASDPRRPLRQRAACVTRMRVSQVLTDAPTFKRPQSAECADKSLLKDILGIGGISDQKDRQPIQPLRVPIDQGVKCLGIAASAAQEIDVVRLRVVLHHVRRLRRSLTRSQPLANTSHSIGIVAPAGGFLPQIIPIFQIRRREDSLWRSLTNVRQSVRGVYRPIRFHEASYGRR